MEILTNTGAKLWSKDDYSNLWLDVFEQITGTGGKSNIRLIDEAIGDINSSLDGYYLLYENDRLYICKDGDSSTTKLPVSLIDSDGKVASSVDGTTITIDKNGIVHGTTIDDAFSLTSENPVQNKVIKTKFDEVDAQIEANKTMISSNTTAIETLNGEGEGSVKKTVTDEIAKVVADAPEDFDTLKEMSDWIASHEDDASAMNSAIQKNKTDIETLQTDKVDKEIGKSLLADTDKVNYDDAVLKAHTHDNKLVLDGITSNKVSAWDNKSDFSGNYEDLSNKPIIPKGDDTTITMDEDGTLHGSVTIEVDSELSTESENPVQNKVITKELTDHTDASVTDAEGVHGFKVDAENKKAYAKINGTWVEIAGGGETSKTTLNISTTAQSLSGKTITLYTSNGIEVTSGAFNSSLACIISVGIDAGNYYLECEGFKYELTIVGTGITIDVNFDEATYPITFTVEGANEDNITITGNDITPINVIFATSQTSKSVIMTLTPVTNGKSFTFTSSVAKDTTNGTSNYTKIIVLNKSTTSVKCMPEGALYWYGKQIISFNTYYCTIDGARPDIPDFQYKKNSLYTENKGKASGGFATKDIIDLSEFSTLKVALNVSHAVSQTEQIYPMISISSDYRDGKVSTHAFILESYVQNSGSGITSLDVSSITESKYVCLNLANSFRSDNTILTSEAFAVWLE